jgi:hypothetical protein
LGVFNKTGQEDKHNLMEKWGNTWAVSEFVSCDYFTDSLKNQGFGNISTFDYTDKIKKSSRRLYNVSLLGALPSELYNLLHPGVSRFAKIHYKCGIYQFKALKANLWRYVVVLAIK